MGDLQLTKEFKETTTAINKDIRQNPQKYKKAGQWLDLNFYDDISCWKKMQIYSKGIIQHYFFSDSGKGYVFDLPQENSKRERELKKVLQAFALIEFDKFLFLSDIVFSLEDIKILEQNFTYEMFREFSSKENCYRLCEECQKKKIIPSNYKLFLACEEMWERKKRFYFLGYEDSSIVCLLTGLLGNPHTNKAPLDITKFERLDWYSIHEDNVRSERANVIELLNEYMILQNWQNLACEVWQNLENIINDKSDTKYSIDFRSVHWFGIDYSFTPNQAAAVKILWEAWENGTPDVGCDTLAAEVGSDSKRARDIFKGHPALDIMICQGQTKGTYRLVKPEIK